MFAPTKRRGVSYYLSLLIVIAFAFLLVAKLAALQRAEIVAALSDQVAHQEAPEAAAALRQLAAMPRPPVDVLVLASTSADHQLADQAQLLISGLLRQWQRKIDAGKGVGGVSRQLSELAEALGERREVFSRHDYTWLSGTTRKILRLANQIAPSHSPQVAVQCDTVLATIAANEARIAVLINRDLADAQQPIVTEAFASVDVGAPSAPRIAPQGETSLHAERSQPRPTQSAERSAYRSVIDARVIADSSGEAVPIVDGDTSNYELGWTYPMLNIAPAMPIHAMPARIHQPSACESSGDVHEDSVADEAMPRPMAGVSARDLLRRWLAAEGSDVYVIEEELTYRGFGRLSGRLVEQLFSDNVEDRLRLVDDVLTAPGIDARPWLVLLADDAEADVRLLALTIMATSDDPILLDKACQVALHDRDPRIAGLASRLRERRDNAQRR